MGLFETNAIVLKNYSLSESDKIVLFLTQKHGLIRGVAKGARRLNSKFGSGLEPLSIVSLGYYEKEQRELVSIHSIELKESFFQKISDFRLLSRFSYLIGLLTEFLPPNDPDDVLFRMTRACLREVSLQNLEKITLYFEIWVLKQAGYLPNFSICVGCGIVIDASDNCLFTTSFEVICTNCNSPSKKRPMNSEERRIISRILKTSPADFCSIEDDRLIDIENISGIMQRIIVNIIGRK
jgi:DNA repair protein RecO (recombination protein O)